MKSQVKVALAFFVSFIWIQHGLCDVHPDASSGIKWTCTCFSAYSGNQSVAHIADCASSCNCSSATKTSEGNKWVCLCAGNGLPKMSTDDHDTFCFTSCNCKAGCLKKASLLSRIRTGTIYGTLVRFSYSELENATNKFCSSNLIGIGGSSHVYLGLLKDGSKVAIKRMKAEGEIGVENNFITEIELISRLHHCHVVHLLGFCSETQGKHTERLLIFEYVPNGNLRERLNEATAESLDWGTRVSIALGAAKGLEYLHEAAAPRIMHRDIKSTNILLDENWRAKISDLGMAKCLRNDDLPSSSSSPVRMQGTFGYIAPEYAIAGRGSLKSDVFGFGVVLLELISGRQPIQKSAGKEESLVIWATPRLLDSKRVILEFPDPELQGNYPVEEMHIMAYLAKECLLLDPDSRPSMSEVVQILSTIASGKCGGRKFSFNRIQRQSSSTIEMSTKQTEAAIETEELRCFTSKQSLPQCSFFSNKNVKKQILQTPKARNFDSQYEESVDITEPQFESFSVPQLSDTSQLHVSNRQKQLLLTQY